MRILMLAEGLEGSSLDDSARWLSSLATSWVARGHRVQVVCTSPLKPWQTPEDPPGVTVFRPGPETFEAVLGEVLSLEPDVVHVASRGPLGARVVEILHQLPVLLDVHDYWPICPQGDLLRRPSLGACGEQFPFRGCLPCAGPDALAAMEERLELVAAARVVIAHSPFSATRLAGALGFAVDVVEYGVDTTHFRPQVAPPLAPEVLALVEAPGEARVLFLGPPTPARGADLLTDLLVALRARIAEVELVVPGRNPASPDWGQVFLREAAEMGLEGHVRVLPTVPAADLPALYAACRVAVAPLRGPDPGGLAVLEAMAAGLPIVGCPLGAMQDLLRHGEQSVLLPPEAVADLATAVWALLADPASCAALADAARLAAVERHDFERTVTRLEELYQGLRSLPRRHVA